MQLDQRHGSIVQLVARFGQLTTAHIQQLLFHDLSSRTPCYRALDRLVRDDYLIRLEHRIVGGAKGGSGVYVYALGRRGFFTYFGGRWRPDRRVNYHALGLADCWLIVQQLMRSGQLRVHGMSTEPDSWVTVGGRELRPDMTIDVTLGDKRRKLWLEMDMATEGQKQVRGQLQGYWLSYQDADIAEWPEWPTIVWVAVDAERDKELCWLIEQEPAEAQAMFRVCTRDTLANLLVG